MAGQQQRRAKFVEDMLANFGDRALEVARSQHATAVGAAAREWSAIVGALQGPEIETEA